MTWKRSRGKVSTVWASMRRDSWMLQKSNFPWDSPEKSFTCKHNHALPLNSSWADRRKRLKILYMEVSHCNTLANILCWTARPQWWPIAWGTFHLQRCQVTTGWMEKSLQPSKHKLHPGTSLHTSWTQAFPYLSAPSPTRKLVDYLYTDN